MNFIALLIELCNVIVKVTEEEALALGESIEVKTAALEKYVVRLVTCCNHTRSDIEAATKKICYVIKEIDESIKSRQ